MSLSPSPSFPRGIATVGYSTELPDDYRVISAGRDGFDIYFGGRLIGSDFDNYAAACFYAQEHAASIADEEAAAAEAEAEYTGNLAQQVAQSAADLIYALDRGDFGSAALKHGDTESAYLADLRAKLAAYKAAA